MKTKFIDITPGIALPEYFMKIVEKCKPVGVTKKVIEVGVPLKADYIPPYVEMMCIDLESVIMKAKATKLRIYHGKKHVTITDGVYQVRIYKE